MPYQYNSRNPGGGNFRGTAPTTTNPFAGGLDAPAVSVPDNPSIYGKVGGGMPQMPRAQVAPSVGNSAGAARPAMGGGGSQSAWAGALTGNTSTNTGNNPNPTHQYFGNMNQGTGGGGRLAQADRVHGPGASTSQQAAAANFTGQTMNADGSWTQEFIDYMRPFANQQQQSVADAHYNQGYFTPQQLATYQSMNEFADPNLFRNQYLQNQAYAQWGNINQWNDPQSQAHFQGIYDQMVADNPNVDMSPATMQAIDAHNTQLAYNNFTDPNSYIGNSIANKPALANVNIPALVEWAQANNVSPTTVQAMLNNTAGGLTSGTRVVPTEFLNQG